MSILTQGTQLYGLINGVVREIECITAFNPGTAPADQIDDTCLSETNTRTYKKGLRTPGQASVTINADPKNESHYLFWQLAEQVDGGDPIQWAIGWSDGVDIAPTVQQVGSLSNIEVTNGGTGYTSAPTVSITGGGGTGATATAIVDSGSVIGVNITNPGTGYTSPPTVAFSGGAGTGAAATAERSTVAELVLPDTRTWYTFGAYVSDFPFDFQGNTVVTTAASMQRSGPGVWLRKAQTP
ncbi:phage tail tube protein [Stenotrophomonas sp.]|uniref:phage tail tube protein n=1 Tax=Stenotrophomonas sp. TaxID=69392 RepID=UPI0028B021FF|nr:phage tail tube protein [Stenotrophomonas sp.]